MMHPPAVTLINPVIHAGYVSGVDLDHPFGIEGFLVGQP